MHGCVALDIYIYIGIASTVELTVETKELNVTEDGGSITITIALSPVLPQKFYVKYRLISGTASRES